MKITKNITLGKLTQNYPQSIEVLLKYGLHCIGCAISAEESLEEGAKAHGMSKKEIEKMAEEINKIIKIPNPKHQ